VAGKVTVIERVTLLSHIGVSHRVLVHFISASHNWSCLPDKFLKCPYCC